MTSHPSTPNGRRRWLIVATTVLVLVAIRTWWYWPRIDERFVASWTITSPDIWGWVQASELKRDGSAEDFTYQADDGIRTRSGSHWFIAGNKLIVASPRPSIRDFDLFLEFWLAQLLGGGDDLEFEIQEISPSKLRLHETATGIESVYVR